MESAVKIRRMVLRDGRSIRSVSRATGLSRTTIRKYLRDASPPVYHRQDPPARHKLCDGYELRLQDLFERDLKRPRREHRTAVKLYEHLVGEGYTGSYSPVQRFIRDLKRAGPGAGDAFVPLLFQAGDALQFDWSEEHVVLSGVAQKVKVAHFCFCVWHKPPWQIATPRSPSCAKNSASGPLPSTDTSIRTENCETTENAHERASFDTQPEQTPHSALGYRPPVPETIVPMEPRPIMH